MAMSKRTAGPGKVHRGLRVIQDMYRECETRAGEISTSGRMFCYVKDQH